MRCYLSGLEGRLQCVEPHLGRNPELVARLAAWEESWEIGARYVECPSALDAIARILSAMDSAKRASVVFATMCDNQDAEFFLVLPRIVLLCFLDCPTQCACLLQDFLPHRFQTASGECLVPCSELESLADEFSCIKSL